MWHPRWDLEQLLEGEDSRELDCATFFTKKTKNSVLANSRWGGFPAGSLKASHRGLDELKPSFDTYGAKNRETMRSIFAHGDCAAIFKLLPASGRLNKWACKV